MGLLSAPWGSLLLQHRQRARVLGEHALLHLRTVRACSAVDGLGRPGAL